MKNLGTFLLMFFWGVAICFAEEIVLEFVPQAPIHEAFITQELGTVILQAVPFKPPVDLVEYIPDRLGVKGQWIHGYWAFCEEKGDFVWVSGVWRRAPPGQRWISGKWVHLEEGWVWLRGFWSPLFESDIRYIATPPPDLIEENIPKNLAKNYFWVPSYWSYEENAQEYRWVQGRWYPLEEKWQYVPAHYEWREKGYIFIPSYWDYSLEERGMAYVSIYVEPSKRAELHYTPNMLVEPLFIAEALYKQWPNYPCFFQHHFTFHSDIWLAWGAVPPWWHWNHWWTLSWQSHWWLWWWWTHPSYPASPFMDKALATQLTKPPLFVVEMMKVVPLMPQVLCTSVVGEESFRVAIEKVTGHSSPILPVHPRVRKTIMQTACTSKDVGLKIRPSASSMVLHEPERPTFGPISEKLRQPPLIIQVPPYPQEK